MATITSDTFLDDGAARTPGEAWTNNGGSLIIRTDTRVHANAPASMTGSIGNVTCSLTLGGGYKVDSTKVREVYFNGGGGTVPAIGTTISQGGVSGYLLGVWPNLTSAPTTPGSAMPTTGFLKFREVTGGSFAAGALTGITATATGADVVSWLEIIHDQNTVLAMSGLGDGFVSDGLIWTAGTTTGTPGQQIQFPTNGGGAGTLIPAVLIETNPGSGVYEPYQALYGSANGWANTYLMTDERAKFVQAMDNGVIRIGSDGTNNCGYTPVAGCKIAIYNIFLRQCTTAARASNAIPSASLSSRPRITANSCNIAIANTVLDWYLQISSATNISIYNMLFADNMNISAPANPVTLENIANGQLNQSAIAASFIGAGITFYSFKKARLSSKNQASGAISLSGCYSSNTLSISDISLYASVGTTRASAANASLFTACKIYINRLSTAGGVNSWSGGEYYVDGYDYIDRLESNTTTTVAQNAFVLGSNSRVKITNITFGLKGLLYNTSPYSSFCSLNNNTGEVLIGIAGSISSPAEIASNAMQSWVSDSGNNQRISLKRLYASNTRSQIAQINPNSSNIDIDDCYSTRTQTLANFIGGKNAVIRGCGFAYNQTAVASVYGLHFSDGFTTNNDGHISLAFNSPTNITQKYISGSGYGFDYNGGAILKDVGNNIIVKCNYTILKHESFKNTALIFNSTNHSNHVFEYSLDGVIFKTLTPVNLSQETISASGFDFYIKATCIIANKTNNVKYITVFTNSSLTSQENNLYPLQTAKISISGLASGANTIFVYDQTNNVELINTTATTSTFEQYAVYNSDAVLYIGIMQATATTAKIFYETIQNFTIDGATILVDQKDDHIYSANGIDGFSQTGFTIDDATLTISINKPGTGSPMLSHVTWQEAYAAETAWLTTATGIRHFPRVLFASDTANYKLLNDFKIKNTGSYPLIISGGYGVSGTTGLTADILDYSGGAITTVVEHVVPYQVSGGGSGGGLTTDEHNKLMALPAAADIWTNPTRSLTDKANFSLSAAANTAIKEAVEASNLLAMDATVTARPTLAQIVAAPELAKEDSLTPLATSSNIDAAVLSIKGANNNDLSQVKTVADGVKAKTDQMTFNGSSLNANTLTLGTGAITAASIVSSALNGKGDWLLSSSYTAPPSIAGLATSTNITDAVASLKGAGGYNNTDLFNHTPSIDLTGIATTDQVNAARDSVKGAGNKDLTQVFNNSVSVDLTPITSMLPDNGEKIAGQGQVAALSTSINSVLTIANKFNFNNGNVLAESVVIDDKLSYGLSDAERSITQSMINTSQSAVIGKIDYLSNQILQSSSLNLGQPSITITTQDPTSATLQSWIDKYKLEHPVGIIIEDSNLNTLGIRSTIFYSGYKWLDSQLREIVAAQAAGTTTPPSQISLTTIINASEWAMIRPLFMLYVERETALHLEASRGMGADVYGRTVAEVEQDIDRMEAGYHQSTFCEEMLEI